MRRLHGLLALLAASAAAWTVASTAEATGGIDTAYGARGRAVVAGAGVRFPAGAAPTPDGGAILAGGDDEARPQLVLARLDPAGRPLRSFGRAGVVVRPGRVPGAVAVLPDGRILAAGSAPGARRDRLALDRFDERGRSDPTFGKRGEVLRSFGDGRRPAAFALILLPDGRILVAGTEIEEGVDADYGRVLLARFLPDGRPDPGFGRDGAVRMRLARRTAAAVLALALTADGGILAAGATQTTDEYDDLLDEGMLIARFDSAGRPDRSFGTRGTGVVDLGGRVAQGSAVTALPGAASTRRSDRSFLRTWRSAARSERSGRLQSHFALAGQRWAAGGGRRGRFPARPARGCTCRPGPGPPAGRRSPTQGARAPDRPAQGRRTNHARARPRLPRRARDRQAQRARHGPDRVREDRPPARSWCAPRPAVRDENGRPPRHAA